MRKLKSSKTTRAIAATLVLAPLAGIAYAGGMGGYGGHGAEGCDAASARYERHHGVDGRLAFLKAEIAITGEQQAKWQAVEDVLRAGIEQRAAHHGERRGKHDEAGKGSTPERLAAHIAVMESHIERMKSMESALRDLYAVLDESQRATADELLPGAGKGHRFMGRSMH